MEPCLGPDETLEIFLNGALRIVQKRTGYRFSIDAILLSRFISLRRNEKAIDLGTGCGILPLLLAKTTRAGSFVGIEIQRGLAALARKNVALNGLGDRITILQQDMNGLIATFPPGSFDVVFSNPPYRKDLTGRVNPSLEKAIARHEIKGSLDDLVRVAAYLLPTGGRCYFIYSASRAIDLLVALRHHRLEPKRLRIVHSKGERDAKFILIGSVKESGVDLKIMRPLFLDEPEDPSCHRPQKSFDNRGGID
jgi:tRNA1Val (adenine37-N6)-methyltransferase